MSHTAPVPSARGHRRRALVLLAAVYFCLFAGLTVLFLQVAAALGGVGIAASVVGMAFSVRALAKIVGPILWGVLGDASNDARMPLAASLLLGAASLFVLAQWHTPGVAIATLTVFGLSAGASVTVIDGMVLTALGADKHKYGSIRLYGTLGAAAGAASTYALSGFGADLAVPALSAVLTPAMGLLVLAAALTFIVPGAVAVRTGGARPSLAAVKLVFQPDLAVWMAAGLLFWSSHALYAGFLLPAATKVGIVPEAAIVAVLAAMGVEIAVMQLGQPWVERLGPGRVLLLTALLATARWAALSFTTSAAVFVALNAVHGLSFGLFLPAIITAVARRVPEAQRHTAQGVLIAVLFGAGGALGGVLAGGVFDVQGAHLAWRAMAGLSALSVGIAAFGLWRGRAPRLASS